jgi:hypothetical protein
MILRAGIGDQTGLGRLQQAIAICRETVEKRQGIPPTSDRLRCHRSACRPAKSFLFPLGACGAEWGIYFAPTGGRNLPSAGNLEYEFRGLTIG